MSNNEKRISRRSFLKGAGAAAIGVAAIGMFGTRAFAGGEASTEPPPAVGGFPVTHPDPVTVDIPAGAIYLAFAGDQHSETPGFHGWLDDLKAVYGENLRHIGFAGDICDKAWDQAVFDEFRAGLEDRMPGAFSVTTGNKEYAAGSPSGEWDELGEGFLRIGEAVATDDYIIYHLGAAQEEQSVPQEDIDALAAYLDDAPANIPIFILSHFPLHLAMATAAHSIPGSDHRQTLNNDALIRVLNDHPNVIFLWGHNHTFQDARYGTIRPAGSAFTWNYDDPTDKIEIGFTYANYGSFCRGDTYGLFVQVLRDEDTVRLSMCYIDTNVPMETKERAELVFDADGNVSADVTPGSGINMDEMLEMSGYPDDPDFLEQY